MPTINEVQDIKPSINYIGTNAQTVYVYPFPIFDEKDIVVLIDDVELTLNVQFTVTGVTDDNGGTIVLTVATIGGEEITLYRDTDVDRLTDYVENGDFLADTVNNDFDRIILMIQELKNGVFGVQRAIRVGPDDLVSDEGLILADVATRAGKVLAFDENGEVIPVELTDGQALLTFVREELTVVPGNLIYPLQKPLDAQNVVVVDGEILPRKSYGTNIDGALVLTTALYNPELMFEVWNRLVSTVEPTGISSKNFAFPTAVILEQLTGTNVLFTNDGIAIADNFGATFAYTNLVDIGKAGTINVADASIYDASGRQFKIVGDRVKLEQLGVPYTETSSVILGYIIALRGNGFHVDLNPRYKLTTFNGQNFVNINEKETIIHRCMGKPFPENTLLAASMAIDATRGQNIALEFDVQISLDGIAMVFHDLNLSDDMVEDDGVTPLTGSVADKTFAELRTYKYKATVGTTFEDGVRMPTFDDMTKLCANAGVKMYPEIKVYRTNADIQIMVDIVESYNHGNYTTFTSFRISDLEDVRLYNQQIGVSWTSETGYTSDDLDRLVAVNSNLMFWPLSGVNGLLENPTDVNVFHSYGFDVAAWTVTRKEQIQDLANIGVHKIISDINATPATGMTAVNFQQRFNAGQWTEFLSAGGTAVYTANPQNGQTVGEVVTLEAPAEANGFLAIAYNVTAGEYVEFKVLARNFGSHASPSQIDLDGFAGVRQDTVNILFDDWCLYTIAYQAPIYEDFDAHSISFNVGTVFTRDAGAQFYRPLVMSSGSSYGVTREIMSGYIEIKTVGNAGVTPDHELHLNTSTYNVDEGAIEVNNVTDILIRPHREADLTDDSAALKPIFARAYITPSFNGMDVVDMKFVADSNNSQGSLHLSGFVGTTQQNLNTTTTPFRVYFEVKL